MSEEVNRQVHNSRSVFGGLHERRENGAVFF